MSFWQIVVPAAASTLVTNPTVQLNTTGYTAVGSALLRDTSKSRRSQACLRVTPTAAGTDGVYYGTVTLVNGTTYYYSFDFWGVLNVPYRAYFASTVPAIKGTPVTFIGTGYWNKVRIEVPWTADANASFRLYVVKDGHASTSPFWIDGLMVTTLAQSTYIDGAQPDCSWDASPYASTSSRIAETRAGGQLLDFDTFDLAVEEWDGSGMPDLSTILLNYGVQDGAYFQRQRAGVRGLVLQSNINANAPGTTPNALPELFSNRKAFINAIKPDAVDPQTPFLIRTTAPAVRAMWIKALYSDGFKMKYSQGFTEQLSPSFLCPSPYWFEEGNQSVTTDGFANIANANAILQKLPSGAWASMGTGTPVGSSVLDIKQHPSGDIYVCGSFASMNGVANTLNIAKWSPATQTWTALSTGLNGAGWALLIDAVGNVYVGGAFTTAGGIACNGIAKWTGAAFVALGVGVGGTIYDMDFDKLGNVWVVGSFVSAGGSACSNIAYWNGAAWILPGGAAGAADLVNSVACDFVTGKVYIGGKFPFVTGIACAKLAVWDGVTWGPVGTGLDNDCRTLCWFNGTLYIGGYFTTANGLTAHYFCGYSGGNWYYFEPALNDWVYRIVTDGVKLYVGGKFTTAGGLALPDAVATLSGSIWGLLDINLPGTAIVNAVVISSTGYTYLGFNTVGATTGPNSISITNPGTAKSKPIFTFTGPGTVTQIANNITGKQISFTGLSLVTGEVAVLDLSPGNISFVSSIAGDLLYTVVPGSNLSIFALQSGVNPITIFSSLAVGSINIRWSGLFWSIDGGVS